MRITLIVSCLEWLTWNLKSYRSAVTLKWYSLFLLRKCSKMVQCSNELMFNSHMRCYATQWSATRLCDAVPSPPRKIAFGGPVKIIFWRFLLIKANGCNMWLISNAEYFVVYLTVSF